MKGLRGRCMHLVITVARHLTRQKYIGDDGVELLFPLHYDKWSIDEISEVSKLSSTRPLLWRPKTKDGKWVSRMLRETLRYVELLTVAVDLGYSPIQSHIYARGWRCLCTWLYLSSFARQEMGRLIAFSSWNFCFRQDFGDSLSTELESLNLSSSNRGELSESDTSISESETVSGLSDRRSVW